MRQTVTVTGGLTTEAPPLHTTGETHASAIRAGIHKLAFLEPVGTDDGADFEQATGILDPELVHMSLQGDAVGSEMAAFGPRHVARFLGAGADLDSKVAVLVACLVRDDLHAVELQHGAGYSLCRGGIVEGRHALLESQGACPWRQRVGLAFQSSRTGGAEDGEVEAHIEAVWFYLWREGFY